MEGEPGAAARFPWVRAAEYQRAGITVCLVDGWWRAWIPAPCGDRFEGTEVAPERHLDVLLDRLDEVTGRSGAGDGADR